LLGGVCRTGARRPSGKAYRRDFNGLKKTTPRRTAGAATGVRDAGSDEALADPVQVSVELSRFLELVAFDRRLS
jgi:hypothetical protein